MTFWRIFCAAVGTAAGGLGLAALRYFLSEPLGLEPHPGAQVLLVLVAFLAAARFLWWALAPASALQRRKPPWLP